MTNIDVEDYTWPDHFSLLLFSWEMQPKTKHETDNYNQ